MATNIIIETTSASGKKLQKAITNVNPNATNYELKVFAQKLNSLTSNTYVGTTRIDRVDISDARSPRDPHFTITPAKIRMGEFNNETTDPPYSQTFTFEYLGDDRIPTYSGQLPIDDQKANFTVDVKAKSVTLAPSDEGCAITGGTATGTLVFKLPATADYDEATAELTFTSADPNYFKNV